MRKARRKLNGKVVPLNLAPVSPSYPREGAKLAPMIDLDEVRETRERPTLEQLEKEANEIEELLELIDDRVAKMRELVDRQDHEAIRERFYDSLADLESFKKEWGEVLLDLN